MNVHRIWIMGICLLPVHVCIGDTVSGNCGAQCFYVAGAALQRELGSYQEFVTENQWAQEDACTLANLSESARAYDIPARLIEFDPEEIPLRDGEMMIAHLKREHFIVLKRAAGTVYLCDPPRLPTEASIAMLEQLSGTGMIIGQLESSGGRWPRVAIASVVFLGLGAAVFFVRYLVRTTK